MSSHTSPSAAQSRAAVTLPKLREMRARGERIVMLTCYDATFAQVLDEAGVDTLLVGDSLGNVLQGRSSTLAVTLADMAYHTECVARAQTAPGWSRTCLLAATKAARAKHWTPPSR